MAAGWPGTGHAAPRPQHLAATEQLSPESSEPCDEVHTGSSGQGSGVAWAPALPPPASLSASGVLLTALRKHTAAHPGDLPALAISQQPRAADQPPDATAPNSLAPRRGLCGCRSSAQLLGHWAGWPARGVLLGQGFSTTSKRVKVGVVQLVPVQVVGSPGRGSRTLVCLRRGLFLPSCGSPQGRLGAGPLPYTPWWGRPFACGAVTEVQL